jgi:hypothetical protein
MLDLYNSFGTQRHDLGKEVRVLEQGVEPGAFCFCVGHF